MKQLMQHLRMHMAGKYKWLILSLWASVFILCTIDFAVRVAVPLEENSPETYSVKPVFQVNSDKSNYYSKEMLVWLESISTTNEPDELTDGGVTELLPGSVELTSTRIRIRAVIVRHTPVQSKMALVEIQGLNTSKVELKKLKEEDLIDDFVVRSIGTKSVTFTPANLSGEQLEVPVFKGSKE